LLSARLFGYEDDATKIYAHDLGMAFQLTNIIRDVKEDALRDRIYLPQDMLQQFEVDKSTLTAASSTPQLKRLLSELTNHADQYYQSAMQALPEGDRWNQRSGLIMSAIYHAVLERIRKNDFEVLHGRTSLPTLSKLWIAWRTARTESKRNRQYQKTITRNAA